MPPRLVRRLLHAWFLVSRPVTLGVRVAAFAADGRVCLVRHTYLPGWHLPGGGVEPGEDAATAARRELAEEAGIAEAGLLALHGICHNRRVSRRDHVVVFVARGVAVPGRRAPDREIAETGFFSVGALPDGTGPATRRRLDEIASGAPCSPEW